MDVLSETLRTIRVSGALFFDTEMPTQWCYLSPRPELIREELLPGKTLLSFHYVAQGRCVAALPGQAPVDAGPGELLLMVQGEQHILASSMDAYRRLRPREVLCAKLQAVAPRLQRENGSSTRLVCGYLACGAYDSIHALEGLPRLLCVRGDDQFSSWLRATVSYCVSELGTRPGATLIAERIIEVVLLQAVRQQLAEGAFGVATHSAAMVRDPFLRRALALVRADPSRVWSVNELAMQAGLSRSALAGRFIEQFGEPPKQYLARWRIALAADALLTTKDPVVRIASNVGYESEAAFNRAFKRAYGLPPSRWRKGFRKKTPAAPSRESAGQTDEAGRPE